MTIWELRPGRVITETVLPQVAVIKGLKCTIFTIFILTNTLGALQFQSPKMKFYINCFLSLVYPILFSIYLFFCSMQ